MNKYNDLIFKFSEKVNDPNRRAITKKDLAPVRELLTALEAKTGGKEKQ